ncbi:LytTR family two component transcriptional regulator [Roseivirga ehrenbergii]|uniref:Two-component system response regulator n=1 Tax=Roseivirga ehrenbergii (strain DSM 102268 / JCM 13514 / KCTC 12282 / NCIMB 14502 / KMM 6017) TaxID=279360 RepID=A0A150XS35_ROSEK|nr:response regulator transcription factor [Roseivirga ehrenbergii]KYG81567.1 two-component system response regulator [Roseivirga ehrenbergii]TCL10733.1 LytTR family two component transcriptional regulator [Roseivirga ehrenbergii]
MIRAIAIDDEPIALDIIESHANKIPFLELKASFTNAYQALEFLKTNSVDLLFLDVKMPDISGMDFLKSLSKAPLVIFTTAYQEYALESYDFQTVDYLLKPFDFGRFLKAVNKASERLEQKNDQHLFLKTGYEYMRLEIAQIKYAKAEGNYVKFVTESEQVLSRMTMQQAEDLLLPQGFLKTHRSFLVNKTFINKIEKHQLSIGSEIIPISSIYYQLLVEAIS